MRLKETLCEEHFHEIEIKEDGLRSILKKNYVPKIFPNEKKCAYHADAMMFHPNCCTNLQPYE